MKQDENKTRFNYMLLNRLCIDAIGYSTKLGVKRPENNIWAKNAEEHIAKMEEVWDELSQKPEWLTKEKLEEIKMKMLAEKVEQLNSKEATTIEEDRKRIFSFIQLRTDERGSLYVKAYLDEKNMPEKKMEEWEKEAILNVKDEKEKEELAARMAYRHEMNKNQRVSNVHIRQDPDGSYKIRCRIDGKWEMSKQLSSQDRYLYQMKIINERKLVERYYMETLKLSRQENLNRSEHKSLSISLTQKISR